MLENEWQCLVSKTLGELEDTQNNTWGTVDYTDDQRPTVFMGVYSFKDYLNIWNHKGRKCILWCGSDIQRFLKGFWLDEVGKMTVKAFDLAPWLDTYCENYVENEVEQNALASVGIRSKVVPSFLGDVNKFGISFKPGNKLYTSVSGDDFKLYGWDKIPKLAQENPLLEFHCYGASNYLDTGIKNIFNHGRVPKEQMNAEIKDMQGALRLTKFDGFSEILAKSILMGQWPVSIIKYPHINSVSYAPDKVDDQTLMNALDFQIKPFPQEPNYKGREYYLEKLNKYPWVKHN